MNGSGARHTGGVLESLTLPELVDLWVEDEIDRRMREVDFFHAEIIDGALRDDRLQVMPLRGGFHDRGRRVEVLVEVRDRILRRSRIGAWAEKKRTAQDPEAFQLAYDKAMAHAIIQLLPATVWRQWIPAPASSA